jgi:hypothetical protein
MFRNRDVGVLINGSPTDEYIRPGVVERRMIIEFKEKPAPPWVMPDGKRARRRQITIFDVKRGLTWEEIKLATKPYSSGQILITAQLDNKQQMQAYGASANSALRKIEELLKLSTAELLPNGVRESGYVEATPRRQALPYIVYPSKAVLVWKKKSTDSTGREDLAGHLWDEQTIEFDLWPENEPPNLPNLG